MPMTEQEISRSDFEAVITHNVVPLRAAPDGGSEQISQAILGDNVLRLETSGEFTRIRMRDAYEGWIWQRHLRPFPIAPSPRSHSWPFGLGTEQVCYVSADLTPVWTVAGQPHTQRTKLVFGTWVLVEATAGPPLVADALPSANEPSFVAERRVRLPHGWQESDAAQTITGYANPAHLTPAQNGGYPHAFDGEALGTLATRFLGTPYLWGGTTPFGFDCSGFVQRLYSVMNVILPRDAYMQIDAPQGTRLPAEAPTQAGDLVFFVGPRDPRQRGITHVGMALDASRFIHAAGKAGVTITAFDDPNYAAQYAYRGAWRCALPKP